MGVTSANGLLMSQKHLTELICVSSSIFETRDTDLSTCLCTRGQNVFKFIVLFVYVRFSLLIFIYASLFIRFSFVYFVRFFYFFYLCVFVGNLHQSSWVISLLLFS